MVLATEMELRRKVLAITVVMVVNISIISKGDAHDCLFTRTDYTVVSGVISATESESEESERFPFFLFRLRLRLRTKPITKRGKVQCDWFILPLLLPNPTIWFSLDHKQNVSDGVVSGIRTLFSLDHKLYASDYDSDSVASENQP